MTDTQTKPNLLTCDEMIDLGMNVSEMLEDLEDHLGPEAVWKLTGLYGGVEAYIPHPHKKAQSLTAQQLGDPITDWIYKTYGAGRINIPLGPQSSRAVKMAAFRVALLSGQSQRIIAQSLGCSIRTVERAKRELVDAGFL